MVNKSQIIKKIEKIVKEKMPESEPTGHDWYHIQRVRRTAQHLAKQEKADLFITDLGALLHDIADFKFSGVDYGNAEVSQKLLSEFGADQHTLDEVVKIVDRISYRGAGVDTSPPTLEGKCVQDADRLDALGAIGIARCFAYGGNKQRPIHNPKSKPVLHKSFTAYKNSRGGSLNHFYEKLLLLKDKMQTRSGKKLAQKRHKFLETFLQEFLTEWNES